MCIRDSSTTPRGASGRPSMQPGPAAVAAPSASALAAAPAQPPASAAAGPASSVVRWEELLSEQRERYYHDRVTGRTQWELPAEGWVQLLADDGSHYYWDAALAAEQCVRGDAGPA
eukprot:11813869-Alexandrium_andersonii.AAC.1